MVKRQLQDQESSLANAVQKIQVQNNSYGFAQAVLAGIGAPINQSNIQYIQAQAAAENTYAKNNPLATTQPYNGSTLFNNLGNGQGVQNYKTFGDGVSATVATLTNGRYNGIVSDLQKGTFSPAQIASRNTSELAVWGTGASAVVGNIGSTSERAFSPQAGIGPLSTSGIGLSWDQIKKLATGSLYLGGSLVGGGGQAGNIVSNASTGVQQIGSAIPDPFKKVAYALAIGGGGAIIMLGLLLVGIDLGLGGYESVKKAQQHPIVVKVRNIQGDRQYRENRRNTGGKPAKQGIPKKKVNPDDLPIVKRKKQSSTDDDIPF